MRYLTDRYFKFAPKLRYDMQPHDIRVSGDALWYAYDYEIDTPEEPYPRAWNVDVPGGCGRSLAHP
jgi:hypothetical protein